ncbi:MAG: hypothetical protein K2X93_09800 [Candidatus Obscuribacterales bacterium]|nr:hypothetical protein [Candidatus Obscuribacterales bacterium]
MTRITPKHLHFTSLIIVAVSLAVGAPHPVTAQAPVGSDSKAEGKLRSTVLHKKAYIASSAVSPPEAGVQLLMGILQRIGTEPQIAMKKPHQMEEASASNQLFMQNATDPALAIRPQALQRKLQVEKAAAPASEPNIIAVLPKTKTFKTENWQGAQMDRDETAGKSESGASGGFINQAAAGMKNSSANKEYEKRNVHDLRTNINRLYEGLKFVDNITAKKSADGDDADSLQEAETKTIKTGGATRGTVISYAPKITDYSSQSGVVAPGASRNAGFGASNGGSYKPPEILQIARERAERADAKDKETFMKADQPAAYRTMRQYQNTAADSLDGAAPADLNMFNSSSSRSKGRSAPAMGTPSGMHIAYMPPSLVAGIPGLRLGSAEDQVDMYLRDKGAVDRKEVNGWKVWSLSSKGKTALQIYLRNGIVEAFRVFDHAYVPDRLGVSLSNKLGLMKQKFGEPAFILKEPSARGSDGHGAKNYVYPVSQVSFQLSRATPDAAPTIQSLLLFQFL